MWGEGEEGYARCMTSMGLELLTDSNIYLWGQWGKREFRPLSWLEGLRSARACWSPDLAVRRLCSVGEGR